MSIQPLLECSDQSERWQSLGTTQKLKYFYKLKEIYQPQIERLEDKAKKRAQIISSIACCLLPITCPMTTAAVAIISTISCVTVGCCGAAEVDNCFWPTAVDRFICCDLPPKNFCNLVVSPLLCTATCATSEKMYVLPDEKLLMDCVKQVKDNLIIPDILLGEGFALDLVSIIVDYLVPVEDRETLLIPNEGRVMEAVAASSYLQEPED